MKKKISIISLALLLAAGTAYGSGYRIPEQSINSTALANAYVAHTTGADSAYFNPANMSFSEDSWQVEASLMYINLPSIDYTAVGSSEVSTKDENFVMPNMHVVSPDYNNFRFGFSVIYPAGLSKRWENPDQRASVEEFTLKTVEFNPTISYKFCDKFAAAIGGRVMYASGVVKSFAVKPSLGNFSRDMDGDTVDYGYNLALSYKVNDNWNIATTYRSKVELGVEGDAVITAASTIAYSGQTAVEVPVPAVWSIGTSYTIGKTTVELDYDKTYWSSYEQLDFNYSRDLSLNPLTAAFDTPILKNWEDTDAFRIGITHKCTERLTTMVGFAIDENPVPDDTLGYELPDSDAKLYSIGVRYKVNEQLEVGGAYLYDDKDDRTVGAGNAQGINGEFSGGGAHLVNIGASYIF